MLIQKHILKIMTLKGYTYSYVSITPVFLIEDSNVSDAIIFCGFFKHDSDLRNNKGMSPVEILQFNNR